jgi:hypothetical protein
MEASGHDRGTASRWEEAVTVLVLHPAVIVCCVFCHAYSRVLDLSRRYKHEYVGVVAVLSLLSRLILRREKVIMFSLYERLVSTVL